MTTTTLPASQAAAQSLASGAAGTALLHIEQALNGSGDWATAHTSITRAVAAPLEAGQHASLYHGAPAIAFVLHAARADGQPRYRQAARALDEHVHRVTQRQLTAATTRIRTGAAATFAEYDLFRGLAGLGALLLRTAPGSDTLAGILRYVTRLSQPRDLDGLEAPGWWAAHDPDPLLPTPGGHANLGMAHGAAGLLALLSLAAIRGHTIDGHHEAIGCLCAWLDRWQQDGADGPWWPQWITRDDLRTGRPGQRGAGRPSWCYGAAGIARAQQLAAIAMADPARRDMAERAITARLSGRQLDQITEPGLCHGLAGLYQVACQAARDARTPEISQRLPGLAAALARHVALEGHAGLLTGQVGVRLALETARHGAPTRSGWDACLLIT